MFQLFPVARKKKNPLILKEIVFRGVFPSLFTVMCCEIGGSVKSVQGLNNDISECPSKSYNPKPQAVGTAAPPTFIHVQHTICKRQPIRKKWEANLKLMIPDCVWTEEPDSCAHFSSQRDLCHRLLLLGKCVKYYTVESQEIQKIVPL